MNKMKKTNTQILVILLILSGVLLGMISLARPKLFPASAPVTDFSAERAMEHVPPSSSAPSAWIRRDRTGACLHPGASQGHGVVPEIQEATIAVPQGTSVIASTVKNIIVKIPGASSSKAILLDAHYDTRAMTPGASDCSSCVATLLETARALRAGPPLQNDVILLFTDNEEYGGGLGAAAFIED